jgi:trimeric autotransporter adhesin
MHPRTLLTLFAIALAFLSQGQANTKLSNLVAPTAVNASLIPSSTNTKDLGTSTYAWKDQYLRGYMYLDGTRFVSNAPGTASFNAFLGSYAGKSTTAINNTALGHNALYVNTTGYSNTTAGAFSLYNNTTGFSNIALGVRALNNNTTGYRNMAVGDSALYTNTTGTRNTAIGYRSLYNNATGTANVAVGEETLRNNLAGNANSAVGGFALYRNTSGGSNTALGFGALRNNTTGSLNNAVGYGALEGNKAGNSNNALGRYALKNNTTGNYNSVIGDYALSGNTESYYNTAVGYNAGGAGRNGYNNVFVGADTRAYYNDLYNMITVGQGTIVYASNYARFGNPATTAYQGWASWSTASDGRFKRNIKENVLGLSFINKLRPVTYTYDASGMDAFLHKNNPGEKLERAEENKMHTKALQLKGKVVYTGFIAQEVEKAAKELQFDFSGVDAPQNENDIYALRYSDFVVPLVKAVQELSEKDKEIDELNVRITKLEALVSKLANGQNNLVTETGALSQNTPNPVTGTTRISYSVPYGTKQVQLVLTNKLGQLVKTISVAISSSGTVDINTNMLSSGVYNYSLVVDGKAIETKKMVVVHDK